MFRYVQFFLLMSFAGIMFGAADGIISSTTNMLDVQGSLLRASSQGEISTSEYEYRSRQADIVFRGSAGSELEKVEGVIVEAENVFNTLNSKMNLTEENTTMASGNFSEAVKLFKSIA